MGGFAGVSVALTLIALLVAILWCFLPFAVFGTKPLISRAIKEAQEANTLLKQLVDQQRVLIEQQKVLLASGRRAPDPHVVGSS